MAITANSWFTAWLGLEINLISIAPLMLIKVTKNFTEAVIKYFLVQAMASTILITSTLFNFFRERILTIETLEILLVIAFSLKAGIPPFHFWFPEIINKLNWTQSFILFTWQKVAPLLLLSAINLNKLVLCASLAVILGSLGGLNQLLLKPLLAYSSISHRGWILLACITSSPIWLNYFLIYSLLSYCIIFMIITTGASKVNHVSQRQTTPILKATFILNILSLGGLPPFLGFLAKISVLMILSSIRLTLLILIFVLVTLISLFFYLRLTYTFSMKTSSPKHPTLEKQLSIKRSLLIWCTSLNILAPRISLML